ncbi:MAG: hypothetical protein A3I44_00455 [Candidatus Sungbacteria bacterium RIFCSPLOWO2_02_FULL_51_17]|uniref:Uncharacterized protein n=1 Tax=Candidatus Sungbacteria bacterium RIFCSPHIGHO2_02_FULL_51_29 TaxID=1802273 RepID=A0A1G2KSX6_9BACT|nr:MAG: hypothetical protein A2676_04835 [Candidatus Sungbacteria bacterium RIFCSPHIGHO2_01_FULL_51_22]OHA02530.1 MAG: hypothetical protein A3C16_00610 [Candidatus Sungbacteria bacterium RIFCSPHIGHO2_02_FULL_51_29]OHA07772.1 MAG: hypothetical protein A3B29_00595 [Candidatus Sungbacteria bacterium RIFCSPLOWO2_01_FULL_51_34]OHA12564.1 MAG: hypothetical protein A3I44_00455 [Candidatus Sungbacteria bacterium RIFCSPLOWO2_02_FULL_51_17]
MPPKLIITTGISGCGRPEYLETWEEHCRERGKKVKVFHMGGLMKEHAREMALDLPEDNILNIDNKRLDILRSAVSKGILAELKHEYKDFDAVVLVVHVFFFWKERLQRSYDRFMRAFSPDMFISFVDDAGKILKRLNARAQWKDQGMTRRDILRWQATEVEVTAILAENAWKPHYVVAVEQPISTLYKLIFHPEIEQVYIAMPISHFREPEDRRAIDAFVERLNQYFVVFNPLSVEAVGAVNPKDPKRDTVMDHHTVNRDLHWFVQQSDKIIPYWPKAVPSPGMNIETYHAFMNGKDVWVVFLGAETSPFTTYFATKFFTSEEAFFAFLKEKYPERSSLAW